jgi:membrane protein
MRAKVQAIWDVTKSAAAGFSEDKLPTLSAALAYSTIFSIAPLLIISIAVAGWAFGDKASTGEIFRTLSGLIGEKGAQSIQSMVESASTHPGTGTFATIAGILVLLIGASGVFGQLQDSLNLIWRVQPVPGRSLATILHQRLLSLSMVMVIAFLLLIALIISAVLAALGKYLGGILPMHAAVWQAVNFAFSFLVVTLLFAAIYKVLPDVHLAWGDVWRGALITALLFTLGKSLIGLYLGRSSVTSSFGAAGSLVVVLLWVYYSSVILFFGAEITRAYVGYAGHTVAPKPHAQFREDLEAAKGQKGPIEPRSREVRQPVPAKT